MTGDRGHCPKCGKFCGSIRAQLDPFGGIRRVEGVCRTHGRVDLTEQDWTYEEFAGEVCDDDEYEAEETP